MSARMPAHGFRRVTRVLLAAALVSASPAARGFQQPAFREQVDTVLVTVSVEEHGRAVTDLQVTDFELRDNDVPQVLTGVTHDGLPIDVTFVLDVSSSVSGSLLTALTRGVNSVGARLGSGDRAGVVTFNQRITDRRPLSPGWPASFGVGGAAGQTSLFDAITASLITTPDPGRHRMAIVFTDGRDTTSFLDGATALDVARRVDTSLFIVALTARGTAKPAHETLLQTLADATGGLFMTLRDDQDLGASFDRVFDKFRTSYVLRYTYKGPARSGWHPLKVTVKRRGSFDVRARQGYFAG